MEWRRHDCTVESEVQTGHAIYSKRCYSSP